MGKDPFYTQYLDKEEIKNTIQFFLKNKDIDINYIFSEFTIDFICNILLGSTPQDIIQFIEHFCINNKDTVEQCSGKQPGQNNDGCYPGGCLFPVINELKYKITETGKEENNILCEIEKIFIERSNVPLETQHKLLGNFAKNVVIENSKAFEERRKEMNDKYKPLESPTNRALQEAVKGGLRRFLRKNAQEAVKFNSSLKRVLEDSSYKDCLPE